MFCKNCGKEIKGNCKFCPGCGSAVVISQAKPINGEPESAGSAKKTSPLKFVFLFLFLLIAAALVIFIVQGKSSKKEEISFVENIPWGEDVETVQKVIDTTLKKTSISDKPISYDDDLADLIVEIEDFDGIKGLQGVVFCFFVSGKLNYTDIKLFFEDRGNFEDKADVIIKKYNKIYGKAEIEQATSDYGYSYCEYNWKSVDSAFFLRTFDDGSRIGDLVFIPR